MKPRLMKLCEPGVIDKTRYLPGDGVFFSYRSFPEAYQFEARRRRTTVRYGPYFIGILGYLLYILDPTDYRLFMGGGAVLGVAACLELLRQAGAVSCVRGHYHYHCAHYVLHCTYRCYAALPGSM